MFRKEEFTTPEDVLFRNKLYEKIDPSACELVRPFIVFPSVIENIKPEEKIEEARKLKKGGENTGALMIYRKVVLAMFYRDMIKFRDCYNEYLGFLKGVLPEGSDPLVRLPFRDHLELTDAYEKIKDMPKIIDALLKTYKEFVGHKT